MLASANQRSDGLEVTIFFFSFADIDIAGRVSNVIFVSRYSSSFLAFLFFPSGSRLLTDLTLSPLLC